MKLKPFLSNIEEIIQIASGNLSDELLEAERINSNELSIYKFIFILYIYIYIYLVYIT